MNKTSLWIVVVVAAAWIGFLMGYAVSSHTGGKQVVAGKPAGAGADAGGYGAADAGGYGAPAAGGYGK
jgi:hypothetical protein